MRQREVEKFVQNGLQELNQLAAQNQSDDFIALLVRLLQEQIGERLGMPASALTEEVLDEKLMALNASEGLIQKLHELFHLM